MKRLITLAAIVTLISLPAMAQELEKGQMAIGIGGGIGLPMGDFGDIADSGILFGGNFDYYVTPQLAIGGEIGYSMFSYNEEYMPNVENLEIDVDYKILSFAACGKYLFMPEATSAYLKGAVGMYNAKASGDVCYTAPVIGTVSEEVDESATDIGIAGGAGFQYKGEGNIGFFAEGMFHNIMTEGSSTQFISVKGGVTIYMGSS